MNQYLQIAQQHLLTPVGLEITDLQKTLDQLSIRSIDQADLYFESTRSEAWSLEEGIIKEASHNIEQGVGVRAISGEKTGFAYSDEIILPALTSAAMAARAIAGGGQSGSVQSWKQQNPVALYQPVDPIDSITSEQKVALRHRQNTGRLAGQQQTIGTYCIRLCIDFHARCIVIVQHMTLAHPSNVFDCAQGFV
jgi:TldD protein